MTLRPLGPSYPHNAPAHRIGVSSRPKRRDLSILVARGRDDDASVEVSTLKENGVKGMIIIGDTIESLSTASLSFIFLSNNV